MLFVGYRARSFVLVGTIALLMACGGGGGSPVATSSTPVATPTAAPTPTPVPLPFGISANCYKIGMGDSKTSCRSETGAFLNEVDIAIERVAAKHPEVFDLGNQAGAGGYLVTSLGRFYLYVTQEIEAQGNYCAVFDGEEVGVKNAQGWSDQYKLVNSDNHVRRGPSEYRSTCYPSAIPLPVDQPPPPAGCKLSSSHSLACSREDSQFGDVVENAITEMQKTHPEIVSDDEVKDADAYVKGVAAILTAKGYCAMPGEEVAVKNTNDFSESYDILLWNMKVRHNGYRVSCWPAEF
jgi:hypothetical protein